MGALVGTRCFSSNVDASDAFFSGKDPSYTAGVTSYLSWFEKTAGVWQIKRQSIASNGAVTSLTTSNATVPTFPACTESAPFFDGMTIGWGIAAAMGAAWGIRFLQRALATR